MKNSEIYILVFLNHTCADRYGGWRVTTIFNHFPSVKEILDHSCLESSNPNDVALAKKLVETKGAPCRLVYPINSSDFFECMIIKKSFGDNLNLSQYLLTGYADMDESRQIQYKSYENQNC